MVRYPQVAHLVVVWLVAAAAAAAGLVDAANPVKNLWNTLFGGILDRLCQSGACESTDDCASGLVCVPTTLPPRFLCRKRPVEKKCSRGNVTYVPGKAAVYENGLVLSQGLTSRLIAVTGTPVKYANGQQSDVPFHSLPDGAAVFVDPKTKNYKYVSNSEDESNGGVGSITFDEQGNVIGYERLLSGTKRNCGGGKTFWNTWLTCEEVADGEIWEVDPFVSTGVKARKTLLSKPYPSWYESAAYDNRNPSQPTFYATIDRPNGPLLRYTPPSAAVAAAQSSNNYSQLLFTPNANVSLAYQYLTLQPNTKTFSWTANVVLAEQSASNNSKNCEGLGTFVSKSRTVSLLCLASRCSLSVSPQTFVMACCT
jgi:Bacterial protein of unknown function (DUF839)